MRANKPRLSKAARRATTTNGTLNAKAQAKKATAKKATTKPSRAEKARSRATAKARANEPRVRRRTIAVDPGRFVRATTPASGGTSSAGSWRPPWGKLFARSTYVTEFLGRLWALFGPPTGDNGKGFEYDVRDTYTGEVLTAYAAASGPSFGNRGGQRNASVDALEALINATPPVDCETTVDYGASQIGIKAGKHFYDYQGPDDDSFAD